MAHVLFKYAMHKCLARRMNLKGRSLIVIHVAGHAESAPLYPLVCELDEWLALIAQLGLVRMCGEQGGMFYVDISVLPGRLWLC